MKMMKRNFTVAVLLIAAATMSAMDSPFPFADLPKDMQREIMIIHLNNELLNLPIELSSLKIAGEKIRAFAAVNKNFNEFINQPSFTLKLIKNFAARFDVTDELVARSLGTRGALERIKLQDDFSDFIAEYTQFSQRDFDSSIKNGVDINWTDIYGNTPLIFAVVENKLAAVKALIKKGANVNPKPRDYGIITEAKKQLFPGVPEGTHLEGGGSPLDIGIARTLASKMRSVEYQKKVPTNQILEMIKVLVDAGANPDTPTLRSIEKWTDRPAVIKAIKDAQAKWHAQD